MLIQGDAAVSEVSTWDEELATLWPWLFARQPVGLSAAMTPFYRFVIPWYYMRVKIHVVPRRIRWWPGGDMTREPLEVEVPANGGVAAARANARPVPGAAPDPAAWDQTVHALARYSTPRLTVIDPSGYPASALCQTVVDRSAGVLRVEVPDWLGASPGPVSLMSHYHDENLWNLRSFLARGILEDSGNGWIFRPTKCDVDSGSLGDMISFVRKSRRAARTYLRRSQVPTPAVPWDKIAAAKKAAREALKARAANGVAGKG